MELFSNLKCFNRDACLRSTFQIYGLTFSSYVENKRNLLFLIGEHWDHNKVFGGDFAYIHYI